MKVLMERTNGAGQQVKLTRHNDPEQFPVCRDMFEFNGKQVPQSVYVITCGAGKFHPPVLSTICWKTAFRVFHVHAGRKEK